MALDDTPQSDPVDRALHALLQNLLRHCRHRGEARPSWAYLIGYCAPSADAEELAELNRQVAELEHLAAEVRPTAEEIDGLLA